MTAASSLITIYFPVDSGYSLANEVLKLSLDKAAVAGGGGTAATYVSSVPADLLAYPAKAPKVRYWWSLLLGPGQAIVPELGVNEIFGRLADNPNFPIYKWRVRVPN
jgi:hypothetical protein